MTKKNYNAFVNWMTNRFNHNALADIANYGCESGFSGLVYYCETIILYKQYKDEIWNMLIEDYRMYGFKSCIELLASFNGSSAVASAEQFECMLVWYAAERVARTLTNGEYKEEEEC